MDLDSFSRQAAPIPLVSSRLGPSRRATRDRLAIIEMQPLFLLIYTSPIHFRIGARHCRDAHLETDHRGVYESVDDIGMLQGKAFF